MQLLAQVEIENKTLKDVKVSKSERTRDDFKLLKNSKKVVDTGFRDSFIKALTGTQHLPLWIFTASHRAQYNGGTQPENSMEAIQDLRFGTNQEKADMVELDIKMSSDGQVYVMHDNYLQRTTDFLDKYPGVGTGQDQYGDYRHYSWNQVQGLTLRKADFSYTNAKAPLFRDVLRYMKNNTSSLINLDIGDLNVFRATWDIVKEEDAFHVCIFKSSQLTVLAYFTYYFDLLPDDMKKKVIFFPMITMNNPGYANNPVAAYEAWENTCSTRCLAKGYELGYRGNPAENALLDVVTAVRAKNRVRVHVFNTYPDTYMGRYRGNVNIEQCCNDAYDARGDWNYLLDPRGLGNYNQGVNGYIITDDPETLCRYVSKLGMRTGDEQGCLTPQKNDHE
ncbi:glycerophosphodiester phosphodiesterase family protein [Chryseobacterium wanjuense]